ncbi:MAG: helix-turn-helix domain-containing protein, partial [Bacteroidota bacterium]
CCPSRSVVALFKVTGLYQFSGIPMGLIAGRYSVDATSLLPAKDLNECREQMFQHREASKAVNVLDNFLLKKLMAGKADLRNIDKIAGYINGRMGNVRLDWLTSQACMSVKTLERHFVEKIGLTPKYFARIIRFKNALQLLESNKGQPDFGSIVETCGYTDQAHLIKEFRHFSNRTPKFYHTSQEILSPFFLESASQNDDFLQ